MSFDLITRPAIAPMTKMPSLLVLCEVGLIVVVTLPDNQTALYALELERKFA